MNAIEQNNLHQYASHHEIENQATSERNDVDFDEKYVELKKEIAKDDSHQHVEESEKASMDQPLVSMREYVDSSNTDVGVVFNADIPGSSTLKQPTLDDYPDLTMTHIVELDPILNASTTPDVQPRNRNSDKYDTSPYIRDCGLYTCLFAEYIGNGIFDMHSVDIDAKYHRQRYATIIWHYEKTKNEDDAISESEVTGMVVNKFGGPRIAKEHAPDTTNYPTPRPQTRNLR
uniref:Ulp1 protease family, C-terminal catalytic domain containing protein n=1 Tax=Solanum tuberosum TaxID=4113 RepID=M0ZGD8_SOLTU